jgi:WD40 repeat protein
MNQISVKALDQYKGHFGGIYSIIQGSENDSILSAGSDGLVCKWNIKTGNQGTVVAQTGERIFCLYLFKNENILFAGTMQGDLFQIQLNAPHTVRRLRFHQSTLYRMSSLDHTLIVVSALGIVSLWDAATATIINHLKISNGKLRSLAVDPFRKFIYIGDSDGRLYTLQFPSLELIDKKDKLHEKTVFSLHYLPKEQLLITGGMDAHLKIINEKGNLQNDIKAHWYSINDICELETTPLIATASRDKSIRIWNKNDWSLVKEISTPKFAAHRHSANSLYWYADESILFSAGDDSTIFSWKLETQI